MHAVGPKGRINFSAVQCLGYYSKADLELPKMDKNLLTPAGFVLWWAVRRSENDFFDLFNLPHPGKFVVRFG